MGDLLLPRTDAGAGVQAVVLVAVFLLLLVMVRRNRDLTWFVAGSAVLTLSLVALRTVH